MLPYLVGIMIMFDSWLVCWQHQYTDIYSAPFYEINIAQLPACSGIESCWSGIYAAFGYRLSPSPNTQTFIQHYIFKARASNKTTNTITIVAAKSIYGAIGYLVWANKYTDICSFYFARWRYHTYKQALEWKLTAVQFMLFLGYGSIPPPTTQACTCSTFFYYSRNNNCEGPV